jgi:hypothetical protein
MKTKKKTEEAEEEYDVPDEPWRHRLARCVNNNLLSYWCQHSYFCSGYASKPSYHLSNKPLESQSI